MKTGRILSLLLIAVLVFGSPARAVVQIEYFHQQGCSFCEKVDPLIRSLESTYGNRIALDRIEIDDWESTRHLISYGVTEVPAVVINRNRTLLYAEITPEGLDREIRLAESGGYPVPANRRTVLDNGPLPAVLLSFLLGFMTGFSPCLLGSLVVLLAAEGGLSPEVPRRYSPLVFGAGILTAYLLLAGAILGAGIAIRPGPGLRLLISGAAGILAIGIGLVQIGLLPLPSAAGSRSAALARRFRTLPGIFAIGVIFAILFAPCAMAPVIVLAGTLLITGSLSPALMLPAFALGILVPFGAIALFRHALPGEKMLEYARLMQIAGGLLLVAFGIWLIAFR